MLEVAAALLDPGEKAVKEIDGHQAEAAAAGFGYEHFCDAPLVLLL